VLSPGEEGASTRAITLGRHLSMPSTPLTARSRFYLENEKFYRWVVALAVMMSAVMELVDTSAVNVSIPYIAGNLSASIDEATWVLTSYLVSNAVVLPLTGWPASRFGRKRLRIDDRRDRLHGGQYALRVGADTDVVDYLSGPSRSLRWVSSADYESNSSRVVPS
jgi:hypothetical protein